MRTHKIKEGQIISHMRSNRKGVNDVFTFIKWRARVLVQLLPGFFKCVWLMVLAFVQLNGALIMMKKQTIT